MHLKCFKKVPFDSLLLDRISLKIVSPFSPKRFRLFSSHMIDHSSWWSPLFVQKCTAFHYLWARLFANLSNQTKQKRRLDAFSLNCGGLDTAYGNICIPETHQLECFPAHGWYLFSAQTPDNRLYLLRQLGRLTKLHHLQREKLCEY